jgi:hypothetical protein
VWYQVSSALTEENYLLGCERRLPMFRGGMYCFRLLPWKWWQYVPSKRLHHIPEDSTLQHNGMIVIYDNLTEFFCIRSQDSSVAISTGWMVVARFLARARDFSPVRRSRPILRPTQPPHQCAPGAPFLGVKRPGRETDHLVPRSRMRGSVPPLTRTSSWRSV